MVDPSNMNENVSLRKIFNETVPGFFPLELCDLPARSYL